MYISTPYSRVVALDPTTGKEVWVYTTPAGSGVPSLRGVEYWPGDAGHSAEVLFGTRDGLLIALDAKTGKAIAGFGTDGVLDMRTPEVMNGATRGLGMTSPPIVFENLVITGSAVPEQPSDGPAGDVRAWDVTTGKLIWTFHSVPRPGETGHDTWRGDDWKNRTGTNVWGFLTIDKERGIVYMPFGTPGSLSGLMETGPAMASSAQRWWQQMPIPESCSGTSRSFTMTCGTTISKLRPYFWTSNTVQRRFLR